MNWSKRKWSADSFLALFSVSLPGPVQVVEKWAGRLIPLTSSVLGAGLNYYFVKAWGERARTHFRERHLQRRNSGQLPYSPDTIVYPENP